ncbi:hypothetical protein DH2020_015565 [Rehmannia glutinosa]|uniref:Era-type G domain-containing protein n=1 Tax=Rehmannia glutinosa TaxID=99300 RepID=A0ABR0WUN7_REHGL
MKEFALQYNIPLPPTTKLRVHQSKNLAHFQATRRNSRRAINYSNNTSHKRTPTAPLEVQEFEEGFKSSRYYVRTKDDEEYEEEEDESISSSMLLSLSVKPDRTMALLDDYEMEEMDLVPDDPNHRSGYVAVVGKPNVGKSTLSNQMLGQKLSIVTDKPQTTRHRILGICSGSDYQMILYDTPGVIEKKMHKLDSMMMKNVRSAAINADCVIVVVDASKAPQKIDEMLEDGIGDRKDKSPTLLVLNKKDLIKPGEIAKKIEWYEKFTDVDEVIPVSAKYGHGVDDIKEWILSKLPYGPAYYPKVNVVSYKNRPNAKDFIQVEIVVEKNSQKIILIGKEGKALKLLATAARLDIEDFLQKKVFLEAIFGDLSLCFGWIRRDGGSVEVGGCEVDGAINTFPPSRIKIFQE